MSSQMPPLGTRIDELEADVVRRRERLQLRWHETQGAARALLRPSRAVTLAVVAVVLVVAYVKAKRA